MVPEYPQQLNKQSTKQENQQLNQGNDFIQRFTAQRNVLSGTENTSVVDSYDISHRKIIIYN